MKSLISFAAGLLLACGVFLPEAAYATGAVLCAPSPAANGNGSRQVGGTNSQVPSQATYTLNGRGCAWIGKADVAYFQSQGYTFDGNFGVTFYDIPVAATGTTSYQVATLPAHAAVIGIGAENTDATHAVTSGITCGFTSGGTTLMSTALLIPVATSATVPLSFYAAFPNILLSVLAAGQNDTTQQPIWCQSASSWNTPTTVTISVYYRLF